MKRRTKKIRIAITKFCYGFLLFVCWFVYVSPHSFFSSRRCNESTESTLSLDPEHKLVKLLKITIEEEEEEEKND